jgi:hypothetical protein
LTATTRWLAAPRRPQEASGARRSGPGADAVRRFRFTAPRGRTVALSPPLVARCYGTGMSAAAEPTLDHGRPERRPDAIAAELPPELREQFLAEYRAALEVARDTLRLDQLDQVIEIWWRTAWARRSPRYEEAVRRAGQGGEPFTPEQYTREFLG